jgi:short-subunit dehydrogenase
MSTALVTGASSGIGLAFARRLAGRGQDLIMVARDHERLSAAAEQITADTSVRCDILSADLSTATGVAEVIDLARSRADLDTIVANAGTTRTARAGQMDPDEIERLVGLLGTGVIQLIDGLIAGLIERGRGEVVVVSSIASGIPMPKSAVYAAAKAAATSYARSLHRELIHTGVRVTAVNPGYVRTGLHEAAGLGHLHRRVPGWLWVEPDDVVDAAERALRRRRASVVPGRVYRLASPFLASAPAQGLWSRMTRRR